MGKNQKPSEFEMDEQGLKKLAVLLRELRGTKSYDEVARDTGIGTTNIQKLESEMVKKPNMYILKTLAEYYKINPFKFYDLMNLYSEENFENHFDNFYYQINLFDNLKDLTLESSQAFKKIKKSKLEKVISMNDSGVLKNIKCCYNSKENPLNLEIFYISDKREGFSIAEVWRYMDEHNMEKIQLLIKNSAILKAPVSYRFSRNSFLDDPDIGLGDNESLVDEVVEPSSGEKFLLINQFRKRIYETNSDEKEEGIENHIIEKETIVGIKILDIKLNEKKDYL